MAHKWTLRNKISDGEDWELPMIEHNCDGRSSQLHIRNSNMYGLDGSVMTVVLASESSQQGRS